MNRSFNSRGISPALLGENSGSSSLSFADNSSNSLLNGSVTSHNGYVRTWTRIIFSCCHIYMLYVLYIIPLVDCTRLNYPTPFIGKLVTNEYAVNGNHFTPGKLKASVSSAAIDAMCIACIRTYNIQYIFF